MTKRPSSPINDDYLHYEFAHALAVHRGSVDKLDQTLEPIMPQITTYILKKVADKITIDGAKAEFDVESLLEKYGLHATTHKLFVNRVRAALEAHCPSLMISYDCVLSFTKKLVVRYEPRQRYSNLVYTVKQHLPVVGLPEMVANYVMGPWCRPRGTTD